MPRKVLVKRKNSFIQDTALHPMPYPKTTLPAAGGTFTDPTFGTTIIRVTDATNAASGVDVFSDAHDMQWNCDGTLFLARIMGVGTRLYGFNRSSYALTDHGLMNSTTLFDGAQWHPSETGTLFACDGVSKVYKFTNLPSSPSSAPALVHDFASQLPTIDNANSRVGLSDTGRYISLMGDSGASPVTQEYDYVWVWDTSGGGSLAASVHTPTQFGAGTYLHSSDMIPGDTYLRLGGTTGAFGSVIWNWQANTFSGSITTSNNFDGHKSFGLNVVYNPAVGSGGPGADTWLTRACATPTSYSTLLTYPLLNGGSNHSSLWDSHSSKVLPNGRFSDDPGYLSYANAALGANWTWTLHSGAIWKIANFASVTATWVSTLGVDTMYVAAEAPLTLVGNIPTGAGEFHYASGTDTLYAWLADSSNPNSSAQMGVFKWVPCAGEILMNIPLGGGSWGTQRLCHHRTRGDGGNFLTYPLAHPDPQGRFVLFTSNWDVYNGRVDMFIVDGGA